MESTNGWAKAEMFVDFRIGESEDVPKAVTDYVRFFDEERPMRCLGHLMPKQFRKESLKDNESPFSPRQRLHLPMAVYPPLGIYSTFRFHSSLFVDYCKYQSASINRHF